MKENTAWLFVGSVFAIFLMVAQIATAENWPRIEEVRRDYFFPDSRTAHVAVDILSQEGKKAYNLECHPGDYAGDPFFDYSGFFHCRLIPLYSEERLGSLLTDSFEEKQDWENRGRFLWEHFLPSRVSYKDWGRERHFLLRGMEITLMITEESFERRSDGTIAGINSFRFTVDVKNYPYANRRISEPPEKPRPEWFYGE